MDYNILIILGVCLGAIVCVYLIKYLKNKNIITEADLFNLQDILKISPILIKRLNIKNVNEEKVILIITMIINGLDNAVKIIQMNDVEEIYNSVCKLVYEQCQELKIQIDDDIKVVVEIIVKYLLDNKYSKMIISNNQIKV